MQKFNTRLRLLLICVFILSFTICVSAHPGRTDSNGGHYNRKTGEYHYHNGSSAGKNTGGSSDTYSYSHFEGPTKDYSYYSDTKNKKEENGPELPEAVVWVLAIGIVIGFNFVIPMLLDKKQTKVNIPSINNSSNADNQSEDEKTRLVREKATQEFYSQQHAKPKKTKHKLIYIAIIVLFFALGLAVWQLLVVLVHVLFYGK